MLTSLRLYIFSGMQRNWRKPKKEQQKPWEIWKKLALHLILYFCAMFLSAFLWPFYNFFNKSQFLKGKNCILYFLKIWWIGLGKGKCVPMCTHTHTHPIQKEKRDGREGSRVQRWKEEGVNYGTETEPKRNFIHSMFL